MIDEQELLNRWRLVLGKYAAQDIDENVLLKEEDFR